MTFPRRKTIAEIEMMASAAVDTLEGSLVATCARATLLF